MKLKKFTKNKKQKRIVIGSIVGIILLIGGFTLYKTFALYNEEQSFDVLNGVIPSFVYGDVKLAIQVDGNKQTDIPNKKEDYVVEPKCDNGEIEWDYENWGPIIKNITKETRCSLNFVTNNSLQTLGSILTINNLNSIDTLLTNGNIDKLVASKEGMTYLAKSPTLVNELQSSTSYNEDIKKKILDSEVISEDLKYEAGLPCYLIKNKQVLKVAGDISLIKTFSGTVTNSPSIAWFRTQLKLYASFANSKAIITTTNSFNTKNYTELEINYNSALDNNTGELTGTMQFGMKNAPTSYTNYETLVLGLNGNVSIQKSITNSVNTVDIPKKQNLMFMLALKHNGEQNSNTVSINLNSIALY